MPPTQRARPATDVDATELDAQSAEVQRVLAIRRRRAEVLKALQAQHAARPRPLPLWLSLGLIALLVWFMDAFSQRMWGLEDHIVPVKPEF